MLAGPLESGVEWLGVVLLVNTAGCSILNEVALYRREVLGVAAVDSTSSKRVRIVLRNLDHGWIDGAIGRHILCKLVLFLRRLYDVWVEVLWGLLLDLLILLEAGAILVE